MNASCDLTFGCAIDDAYAGLEYRLLDPGAAQDGNAVRTRHRAFEDCEPSMLEISLLHKGHGVSTIIPSIELSLITHAPSLQLFAYQGGGTRRLEDAERGHQPLKASVDNRYCLQPSNQQQARSLLFLMGWSDRCKIPRALI